MFNSAKLKLLATSMFVAPLALAGAHAQSAEDLNAQALADFRAGVETNVEAETGAGAVYDDTNLDPRGEGDMDAALEVEAEPDADDAADDMMDDAGDAVDDAADDLDDAASETGEWVEETA